MKAPSGHIVNGINHALRLHFGHLTAHRADLVAMAVIIVTSLVFRRGLKAVADYKTQLYQQAQRVVERGTTDGEIVFASQLVAQFLQREMARHAIHRIKDGKALRGLSMPVQFQIAGQDVLDRCLDILSHFMWL